MRRTKITDCAPVENSRILYTLIFIYPRPFLSSSLGIKAVIWRRIYSRDMKIARRTRKTIIKKMKLSRLNGRYVPLGYNTANRMVIWTKFTTFRTVHIVTRDLSEDGELSVRCGQLNARNWKLFKKSQSSLRELQAFHARQRNLKSGERFPKNFLFFSFWTRRLGKLPFDSPGGKPAAGKEKNRKSRG